MKNHRKCEDHNNHCRSDSELTETSDIHGDLCALGVLHGVLSICVWHTGNRFIVLSSLFGEKITLNDKIERRDKIQQSAGLDFEFVQMNST